MFVERFIRRISSRSSSLALAIALGILVPSIAAAGVMTVEPDSPKEASCIPNAAKLCIADNRFEITASWATPDGHSGVGQAVALTSDTGYFWFFSSSNVEVVIKVLNGCGINRRFWVFAGGLTDVKVDLFVRDTATGFVKVYHNRQGSAFQPIEDVDAFPDCVNSISSQALAVGTPTGTTLSLGQSRFKVSAAWRTPAGQTGSGQAVQLTEETGYFWFFSPTNVEMVLKILDACSLNNSYWVFAGGLTNVQVDITVTDTATGVVKTYHNPQGTAFQPVRDTSALPCSPTGLPPDPGEAGKATLAGIDSDHDGVRDDLQRYIVLTYGSSQPTVDALKNTAKILQGSILDSSSPTVSIDHATDLARALECLHSLRPNDARQVQAALLAEALNTEARLLAYLDSNEQLGGAAFPLNPSNQWAQSCNASSTATAHALGLAVPTASTSCGPSPTATLFFGNGVWNTCAQAQESSMVLQDAVIPLFSPEEQSMTLFATACNPSRGHFHDLWRAWKQSVSSSSSGFYRALAGLDIMPDVMKNEFLAESAELTVDAVVDDLTLGSHIGLYRSLLLEGQKVVVVAHSQGNFYANLSSDALRIDERTAEAWPSFGIVSVANPDNRVADNHVDAFQPYTTFTNDLVVNAARIVTGALPPTPNFNTHLIDDWTSHEFVPSYMAAGSGSRDRILQHVHTLVEQLPTPSSGSGNGVITVTLTWDHETDIDLHVFEPDGAHVFYENLQGDSGYLDRDNTTGLGPEHYFVFCDLLQPGTYHVGVNFYAGEGPEAVHVQIVAGLSAQSFNLTLPEALGPDSNDSPQPVADIIVTGNAEEGFKFAIQQRF